MHAELFHEGGRVFGPISVDGCADAEGANKQLDSFWSHFQSHDCGGLNVYANPPFSAIEPILLHFLRAKRAHPNGTAALFVLPFWPTERFWLEIVLRLPSVFTIVQRFEAGADLFTSPYGNKGQRKFCGRTRWPVVILRVAPQPAIDADWSTVEGLA